MINIRSSFTGLVVIFATVPLSDSGYSQEGAVLDSSQHPSSPELSRVINAKPLPLDTVLSWTKRFNGNEEFNETEKLLPTSGMPSDPPMDNSAPPNSMQKEGIATDAVGTVQQIIAGQKKIKIKHGPIERLGMPAMTMLFKVEDSAMLENFAKGQEISFSVDSSSAGFMVTHIEPTSNVPTMSAKEPQPSNALDAQGTVKSIRRKDGKIKIEHGPIERLGMPAMTMVFKVENPSLLNGIEKGGTVEFSVDNSSGGFVITNLKSAE